jgi:seryl-tRNA synthetase
MLDLQYVREHPEDVRTALAKLFVDAPLDELLTVDAERRKVQAEGDSLRAEVNAGSKEVGKEKDPQRRQALIEKMGGRKERIGELEQRAAALEARLAELSLLLPNLPHESVPVGKDDSENRVTRTWGEPRRMEFTPRPHWEIGEQLGVLDQERGVKISGSRFYVLSGEGARLQRALISFMLDLHTREHGYVEVYAPYMVKRECLVGTAQLPKFGENLYRDAEEDLWFIPTAEVPVTNLYRDEVLPGAALPIKNVAYTACFRREKLAAGRDTRGIKRGHQFDKVELVKLVRPEQSMAELEGLIANAEEVLRRLELPYRVVQMCTGDLSFSAAVKYDLEVWSPGVGEWLEVSSCSNFLEFQARRARIRFKDGTDKPRFVHTLNGSGLALPRVLIAVLESYQRPDGSVVVPAALRPYLGGQELIAPGRRLGGA